MEQGHGRRATRRATTISEPRWLAHLNPEGAWAGLLRIGGIEWRREEQGEVTEETGYYLRTLPWDARRLGAGVA